MKDLVFRLTIVSLVVSNCLAMDLALVNPGYMTQANNTLHSGNRSQYGTPSWLISRNNRSQEWPKLEMGKKIKSLISLSELIENDLSSFFSGGNSLTFLPGGYSIDVVTFSAASDVAVREFIESLGFVLRPQNAHALRQLGDLLGNILTFKQEREGRKNLFDDLVYYPATVWHTVCGEVCTPGFVKNFLYRKKQIEQDESDKIDDLINSFVNLTELSKSGTSELIEEMLSENWEYFKKIKLLCEYAKSHNCSISIESGEQMQHTLEDCDDVLINPELPQVIKKMFYMLARQFGQNSQDPDLSFLLKAVMPPRIWMFTEQILPCGEKRQLSRRYTPEQATAVGYLMTLLEKGFCKEQPMTLRFFLDPAEKKINVVDVVLLTETTADAKMIRYLKEKSVQEHFCLSKKTIKILDDAMIRLGKYFLGVEDCLKGIKYLEHVAESADDNDKRIEALRSLLETFMKGICGEKGDDKVIQYLTRIIGFSGNSEYKYKAMFALGYIYFKHQNYTMAIKLLEPVAQDSDFKNEKFAVWVVLAEAYKMNGNEKKAHKYSTLVAHTKIDKTDKKYYEETKAAQAIVAMGEELKIITNSKDYLSTVIKKAQSPNRAIKANALFLLGQIHYEGRQGMEKNLNTAEKYFEQALDIVNSNPEWQASSPWLAFAESIRLYLDNIRNKRKS